MIKILTGRQTDPLQEKILAEAVENYQQSPEEETLSSFLIILSLPQKLGRLIN